MVSTTCSRGITGANSTQDRAKALRRWDHSKLEDGGADGHGGAGIGPNNLEHYAARWQSALETLAIVRRCNRTGRETIARTRSKQKSRAILRLTLAGGRGCRCSGSPARRGPYRAES